MAPEVLFAQNHSFTVDYYALGIIAYELIFGKRPYANIERKALKQEVFAKEVQIKKEQLNKRYSLESMDFINKMIKRKQNERLGFISIKNIFNHPWLLDVDFKKIYLKEIEYPLDLFINPGGNYDIKNVNYNKYLHLTNRTKTRYQKIIINMKEYEHYFKDFYFYFNEFDLFDRKNTKIINKFTNPHLIYCNDGKNKDYYWEKEEESNIKSNIFTYNDLISTGTISNMDQLGENLLTKHRMNAIKKAKVVQDKENSIDKELKELFEEDEDDNISVENNNKAINVIKNRKLKEKIRKCLNMK